MVDINKCKGCHGTLSLHGNNRTDEVQVCVVCHNPNATDTAWRLVGEGPEVPIDFKRMVHSIHAGGMRQNPFVVIGRSHSVNDFSYVRFPAELSNCLSCHIDGTFELPLGRNVLGTTADTRSIITATAAVDPSTGAVNHGINMVDNNPTNDYNITPTASTCSACHDSSSVRGHMDRNGASFSTPQADITSGRVRERCVNCHGPRKAEDVRRVHEIGGGDSEHHDSAMNPRSVSVSSAHWESGDALLQVKGTASPAGVTVSLFDAATGAPLGALATKEIEWTFEVRNLATVPQPVFVRAGDQSAVRDVVRH